MTVQLTLLIYENAMAKGRFYREVIYSELFFDEAY